MQNRRQMAAIAEIPNRTAVKHGKASVVEPGDAVAAERRRIDRFGWCRGQEDAASVLREIARAIEMEGSAA